MENALDIKEETDVINEFINGNQFEIFKRIVKWYFGW